MRAGSPRSPWRRGDAAGVAPETPFRASDPNETPRGDPMSVPIYTVDAFTDRPFAGNPAGVCLLEAPRDAEWMQDVAREMNLSETAFLVPHEGDGFDLRWFTPTVEVSLCGHATLASAHVLWESGTLGARETARFHTQSGLLSAARRGGTIEMDFPAKAV